MLCFEWWSFEILILVSGILPNPEQQTSVLSICLTTITLMYTIPYGLGAAASTRVANELGGGNPEGARSSVWVVMCIAVMEAVIITIILLASQHILGYAYSSDKDVVAYRPRMRVATLGCLCQPGFVLSRWDSNSTLPRLCSEDGSERALDRHFLRLHTFLLLAVITFFSNWQKMSEKARERVFSNEPSDKEPLQSDGSNLF
ncbi:protein DETOXIFICATION 14-like [Miscanthus floridulus]|uniref:protein DETOXIFICATION 14-like n=1 Tax=Miscanthus floridulus TaxID=154761 RepID=UPI00345781AB